MVFLFFSPQSCFQVEGPQSGNNSEDNLFLFFSSLPSFFHVEGLQSGNNSGGIFSLSICGLQSCFHSEGPHSGNNSEVNSFFFFPASQVVSTLMVSKVETTQEPFTKKSAFRVVSTLRIPKVETTFFL